MARPAGRPTPCWCLLGCAPCDIVYLSPCEGGWRVCGGYLPCVCVSTARHDGPLSTGPSGSLAGQRSSAQLHANMGVGSCAVNVPRADWSLLRAVTGGMRLLSCPLLSVAVSCDAAKQRGVWLWWVWLGDDGTTLNWATCACLHCWCFMSSLP